MAVSVIVRLVNQAKGLCHYCNRRTNRTIGSALQATREHVVPRSMGGANSISNYVLACAGCNNKRGTILFYCECEHCSGLINEALDSQDFIDRQFAGLLAAQRIKVKFDPKRNEWGARQGHVHRYFDTWAEALDYANNGTFRKGE